MTITPFRYPGAKNKLLPTIMEHLDPLLKKSDHFVDLFVGGGSVLLEVAQKYPKIQLYANDKNYWMYCFWKIISDPDPKNFEDLLGRISVKPTLELFYKLRAEETRDEVACAYRAVFFNRTTFSGIFYSGPIGGKEQKSKYTVDCRYNVKKLQQKIVNCRKLLVSRTEVTNDDFASCDAFGKSYPVYLDPPYYVKGDSLYTEHMTDYDHETLCLCLTDKKDWVLSYDDCPEIRNLYKSAKIIDLSARYCINGKKDNWEHKNELLILPGN